MYIRTRFFRDTRECELISWICTTGCSLKVVTRFIFGDNTYSDISLSAQPYRGDSFNFCLVLALIKFRFLENGGELVLYILLIIGPALKWYDQLLTTPKLESCLKKSRKQHIWPLFLLKKSIVDWLLQDFTYFTLQTFYSVAARVKFVK